MASQEQQEAVDFETLGAQEWQLVDYGRDRTAASRQRVITPQAKRPVGTQPARGRNYANRTTPIQQPAPTRGQTNNSNNAARRARATTRATASRRVSAAPTSQPYPAPATAAAARSASRLFNDSPSKAKWRNGEQPSDLVQLPGLFGTIKHEFLESSRAASGRDLLFNTQGRFEVFEDISRRTGAYVKPPSYQDRTILLWGERHQATAARDLIERLVSKCQQPNFRKKAGDWAKVMAYSSAKEADVDWKERRDIELQQLRKAPASSSAFSEKLLFLWPADGPSVGECLGQQLQALDNIRLRFECHIFVNSELPNYICVLGNDHEALRQIVHRIRTKWSEVMVKTNAKCRAYIFDVSESASMDRRIIIQRNANLAKAFLQGIKLTTEEAVQWQNRASAVQSKNEARLHVAVEQSLRRLKFVRGHLRIRVNFGSFVFDNYRLPQDQRAGYGLEEFAQMVAHEQTRGRLIPGLQPDQAELLRRCFEARDLLEPLESTSDSLEKADPLYSVNFEFHGSANAHLHLEAEFAKRPGAQEYETTQRRWVRTRTSSHPSDGISPLQVASIDFDRSDWQIEIKALEFHEASSIDAALRTFSHSIRFRRSNSAGRKPTSQRKVFFPADAPVSRFIEKTALRYRLKGTLYTFEIARYDEYVRKTGKMPGGAIVPGLISEVPSTSWGASLFGPHWDNLLGQHANMAVGHSAGWNPTLETFFPSPKEQDLAESKAPGFETFIGSVKEIAQLLGPSGLKKGHIGESLKTSRGPVRFEQDSVNEGALSANTVKLEEKEMAGLLDADLGTLF